MTKVALLLAFNRESQIQWHHPPLALGYLASYLRARLSDVDVRFFLTADELTRFEPDLIGISSVTQNIPIAVGLAQALKRETDAPIALGGIHVSLLPQTLPAPFDIGVLGEGEPTLADLVRWRRGEIADLAAIGGIVFRDRGRLVQTSPRLPISDLDEVPFPDVEMLGSNWLADYHSRMLMYSSRGCPYKCLFCSGARFWRSYRCFSPDYLMREIESRHATFGTRWFDFWDDLFIGDDARVRQFADKFLERGLRDRVILGFSVRSNLVTPERVRTFGELGVEAVNFGAESGSDRILRACNKTGVTVEVNQRAIDLLYDQGIFVQCSFIFGFPDETHDEMKQTLKFIERNKHKLADIGFFPLLPFPGTVYWDMALERGIVSLDMDWQAFEMNWEELDIEKLPYLNTQASRRELDACLTRAAELRAEIVIEHTRRIQPLIEKERKARRGL